MPSSNYDQYIRKSINQSAKIKNSFENDQKGLKTSRHGSVKHIDKENVDINYMKNSEIRENNKNRYTRVVKNQARVQSKNYAL